MTKKYSTPLSRHIFSNDNILVLKSSWIDAGINIRHFASYNNGSVHWYRKPYLQASIDRRCKRTVQRNKHTPVGRHVQNIESRRTPSRLSKRNTRECRGIVISRHQRCLPMLYHTQTLELILAHLSCHHRL